MDNIKKDVCEQCLSFGTLYEEYACSSNHCSCGKWICLTRCNYKCFLCGKSDKDEKKYSKQSLKINELRKFNITTQETFEYEIYKSYLLKTIFPVDIIDYMIINFLVYPCSDIIVCKDCFELHFHDRKFTSPVIWYGNY